MAEVVLDANVLVVWLDARDVHRSRALALLGELEAHGHETVLLDVLVEEAVSVLCRRAKERKQGAPDLPNVLATVRRWVHENEIRWVAAEAERWIDDVLSVVETTRGRLNFNDALLVVLRSAGVIDDVASFDQGFDVVTGFRRLE